MDILYSGPDFAVCVKPVGLDSENQVPAALREALGGDIFPLHRLDRPVGGVMVYARTKAAAAQLSQAIREGAMAKEYLARVHGTPPEAGDWRDFLWKDPGKNKVFVVKRMRGGVKEARLEFTRLTEEEPCLVRIRLHTGRTHQIRVQFASRGFPLVGDRKYGARDSAPAPMLYCCKLSFPFRGEQYVFENLPEWAV